MENFTCVTFVYLLYCIKLESFRKLPLSSKRNFFKNLCDFLLCDFLLWPIIQQSFQKFVRADLEILACIIFGQLGPKFTLFFTEGFFFVNFTYVTFVFLLCPIMLRSFRKFVRVNPERIACVIFGQNCPRITHLLQKKIFLKLLLNWLLSTY